MKEAASMVLDATAAQYFKGMVDSQDDDED
jgi:hypothetical protein